VFQRRLREVFPIAATSNATIRNANPVHKRLPVSRYTAIAAKAAKGNASKNWKANMTNKPITNRIISSHQKLGSDKFIPNMRILFKQNHLEIRVLTHNNLPILGINNHCLHCKTLSYIQNIDLMSPRVNHCGCIRRRG
jgi:hypothetical protein